MSTQQSSTTQGSGTTQPSASRQACDHILNELLLNFSLGPKPEEMYQWLETMLLAYVNSDDIEANDRSDRDALVSCYMEVKRLIKGIDTYNKLCNFNKSQS